MSKKKLRTVILTHGGAERLVELLAANSEVEIAGIFIEMAAEPKRNLKQKVARSIRYDGYWRTAKKFSAKLIGGGTNGGAELAAIQQGQDSLEHLANELGIPVVRVQNYHDQSSIDLLSTANADLGILYGTNIIKESVFSIPQLGSINIHQGLAPSYRGGPPVFWELFNGESEVGITVHFVAAAVDTGDIVLQQTVPLEYGFDAYGLDYEAFLSDYKAALTEPSAQMIAEAVDLIANDQASATKQDPSLGKRYRLPTWSEKKELTQKLNQRHAASQMQAGSLQERPS